MEEIVRARGHRNVSAEHASTLELTSDDYLTPAGDCIIGIEADRTPADFDPAFVAACRSRETRIVAAIEAAGYTERVEGRGHPEMTFDGDRSLVGRTSDYVDDRTVLVDSDAAAADLDRELVSALAGGAEVTLTLTVG
jgi:hypothetical protein